MQQTQTVGCKRTANMEFSLKFNKTTFYMDSSKVNDEEDKKNLHKSIADFQKLDNLKKFEAKTDYAAATVPQESVIVKPSSSPKLTTPLKPFSRSGAPLLKQLNPVTLPKPVNRATIVIAANKKDDDSSFKSLPDSGSMHTVPTYKPDENNSQNTSNIEPSLDDSSEFVPHMPTESTPQEGLNTLKSFAAKPTHIDMCSPIGEESELASLIKSPNCPTINDIAKSKIFSFNNQSPSLQEQTFRKTPTSQPADSLNMSIEMSLIPEFQLLPAYAKQRFAAVVKYRPPDEKVKLQVNTKGQLTCVTQNPTDKITRVVKLRPDFSTTIVERFREWNRTVRSFVSKDNGNRIELNEKGDIVLSGNVIDVAFTFTVLTAIVESINSTPLTLFKELQGKFSELKVAIEADFERIYLDSEQKLIFFIESETRDAAFTRIYELLQIVQHRFQHAYVLEFLTQTNKFHALNLIYELVDDRTVNMSGSQENVLALVSFVEKDIETVTHRIPTDLVENFEETSLAQFSRENNIYYKIIFMEDHDIVFCSAEAGKLASVGLSERFKQFYAKYEDGVRVTQADVEYLPLLYQDAFVFNELYKICKKSTVCKHHTVSLVPSNPFWDTNGVLFKNYGNQNSPPILDFVRLVNDYLNDHLVGSKPLRIKRQSETWVIPSVIQTIFLQGNNVQNLFAKRCLREFHLNSFEFIIKHYDGVDANNVKQVRDYVGPIPFFIDSLVVDEQKGSISLNHFSREIKEDCFAKVFGTAIEYSVIEKGDYWLLKKIECMLGEFKSPDFAYSIEACGNASKKISITSTRAKVIYAYCCYKFLLDWQE